MEMHVAGVRNLTQVEAAERARLLDVTGYDINLDLTDRRQAAASRTFRSVTEVRFRCAEPGASTFIEVAAESVRVGDAQRRRRSTSAAGRPRRA